MDYKSTVGPKSLYDYMGIFQMLALFEFGIRDYHTLLDFGCGSLRLGRFAIQYLNEGNYYGIEPNEKSLSAGIENNTLSELIKVKKSKFHVSNDCNANHWSKKFDYIIAQSVFTHMPITQIEKSLKSIHEVMKKDSIFLCTYFEGENDNELENWTNDGVYYTPGTMLDLIRRNGFVVNRLNWNHIAGQTWLMVRL